MEKKVSGKHSSMNGFAMMKGRVANVVLASALLLGGGLTAQAQNAALTTCSQSAATAIPQNPNWKANAAENCLESRGMSTRAKDKPIPLFLNAHGILS